MLSNEQKRQRYNVPEYENCYSQVIFSLLTGNATWDNREYTCLTHREELTANNGSDMARMLFFLNCWHFNIYEQENFHAQLS